MRSIAAILLLASTALAQQCFYPAGNPSNDVPCSSGGVSTCCSSKDKCLSNGLCKIDDDASSVQFARGSCTDANWGPGCLQQCAKLSHPGSPWTSTAAVFICGGSSPSDPSGASYCCETALNQGTGCCSGETFHLSAGSAPAAPSTSAAAKPAILLQASTSSSSVAEPVVTTVSSSSSSSSSTVVTTSETSTSHATSYTVTSSLLGNTTTSSTTSRVSARPTLAPNGTTVATGSLTSTRVAPTPTTGAANKIGQAGFGLVMLALGAVVVL